MDSFIGCRSGREHWTGRVQRAQSASKLLSRTLITFTFSNWWNSIAFPIGNKPRDSETWHSPDTHHHSHTCANADENTNRDADQRLMWLNKRIVNRSGIIET